LTNTIAIVAAVLLQAWFLDDRYPREAVVLPAGLLLSGDLEGSATAPYLAAAAGSSMPVPVASSPVRESLELAALLR